MTDPVLLEQLERARALGFLGPGPVIDHVTHAEGFLAAIADVAGTVIDLGAGGGVPGLVEAVSRPDLEVVLVDAMAKRCRFLESATAALGVAAVVVEGRAEVVGRGDLRGSAAAVLARGFATPAVTAECAAPLLEVGGVLVVSEPPDEVDRWPAEALAELGLTPRYRTTSPAMQVLEQVRACTDRYPRRTGVPAKRPLF
jgi:16S rRNA (guanine527-N7)-methyltransferase